jgi:hypothetical protein
MDHVLHREEVRVFARRYESLTAKAALAAQAVFWTRNCWQNVAMRV